MLDQIVWPKPGRYVVAVSGGCDSITLLDLVTAAASRRGYQLVVAHFDHGLRSDSATDRHLVKAAAARYGWPFATTEGRLGQASEDQARTARHRFLERVRHYYDAHGILTAHHQDDLLETSLLNLARGSGRRGLAPMPAGSRILRPLLGIPRLQVREYAHTHKLLWREDSTNDDRSNPRNFIRLELLPAAEAPWREQYLELVRRLSRLNQDIDHQLETIHTDGELLPRPLVLELSLEELAELIINITQTLAPGIELESRLVQELAVFAKTAKPGRRRPLRQGISVKITRDGALLYRS